MVGILAIEAVNFAQMPGKITRARVKVTCYAVKVESSRSEFRVVQWLIRVGILFAQYQTKLSRRDENYQTWWVYLPWRNRLVPMLNACR